MDADNPQYILVGVLTILKTISQWEGLSHILWKNKKWFQTTNQYWSVKAQEILNYTEV